MSLSPPFLRFSLGTVLSFPLDLEIDINTAKQATNDRELKRRVRKVPGGMSPLHIVILNTSTDKIQYPSSRSREVNTWLRDYRMRPRNRHHRSVNGNFSHGISERR
jgi:hypothetical protein